MGEFTHFNGQGEAIMVDVSEKQDTVREAIASGRIRMSEECYAKVKAGDMKRGDMLEKKGMPGWLKIPEEKLLLLK